jgi:hypothetical protein
MIKLTIADLSNPVRPINLEIEVKGDICYELTQNRIKETLEIVHSFLDSLNLSQEIEEDIGLNLEEDTHLYYPER